MQLIDKKTVPDTETRPTKTTKAHNLITDLDLHKVCKSVGPLDKKLAITADNITQATC